MLESKLNCVLCFTSHPLGPKCTEWKVFKTQGTVLCKLMTKNVQEHSKSGSEQEKQCSLRGLD